MAFPLQLLGVGFTEGQASSHMVHNFETSKTSGISMGSGGIC